MKKIFISISLCFFTLSQISAQTTFTKVWETFHDGTLTGKDISNNVTADSSGNIYITGKSFETSAKGDFTTIMYDTSGNVMWKDFYTTTGGGVENKGNKIIVDAFQNIYALGTSQLKGGDIAIVKYNTAGKVWSENYTPSWYGNYYDEGKDIGVDSMGNVYAVGVVTSTSGNLDDVYTFKVDDASNVLWDVQYTGASASDYARAIAVTKGGDCFSLSTSYNFFGSANDDITTIYYDTDGAEQWLARYNGEGDDFDMAVDITIDDAGDQYVCGATMNASNNNDIVAWKQNEFGTRLWTKIYNGSADEEDSAVSAMALSDGKVVVVGRSREMLDGDELDAITLILLDASGNELWTKNYFGIDSNGAVPFALTTDKKDGIYISGFTFSLSGERDGLIMKYDTTGNLEWMDTFDGSDNWYDVFTSVVIDNKYNIIVTGQTHSSVSTSDFVTIKYSQEFPIDTVITDTTETDTTGNDTTQTFIAELLSEDLIHIYPNPAIDVLHINIDQEGIIETEIIICSADGKEHYRTVSSKNEEQIDISELAPGIYMLHINNKNMRASKQFIVSQ
ncbi:MAG: T9SS type A sorting domain-containing protein [Chitinophagales bacterium]|nr:T9SS type A sorting domain-containing protein [Chitinophagales bacterium]